MGITHTTITRPATTKLPATSPARDIVDGKSNNVVSNNLGMLLSLQHSDSFFPSGAMAFSWGLESLMRDKLVYDAGSLADFIESQILHRWLSFDQAIVSAAWHVAEAQTEDEIEVHPEEVQPEDGRSIETHARKSLDALKSNVFNQNTLENNAFKKNTLEKINELDQFVEAMTLAPLTREGSRRLGLTLINMHAKLGTASALKLQRYVSESANAVMPHLAVAQGYLWQGLGMSEIESRAVSAHTVCVSASSAAVRLGLIGHLDAQRIVMRMQAPIASALAQPAPPLAELSSSILASDIASLRHGLHDARMFAN